MINFLNEENEKIVCANTVKNLKLFKVGLETRTVSNKNKIKIGLHTYTVFIMLFQK